MSELDANVIVNGQKAIATVAQTGTVIEDGGAIDATSVIQTESGPQKVVKTYDLNGGGGGGEQNIKSYHAPSATLDATLAIVIPNVDAVQEEGLYNVDYTVENEGTTLKANCILSVGTVSASGVVAQVDQTMVIGLNGSYVYLNRSYVGGQWSAWSGKNIPVELAKCLQNTATGTSSLSILGTSTSNANSINIGVNSLVQSPNSVVIGKDASCSSGGGATCIGVGSEAAGSSVGIGYLGRATGYKSIQLGTGYNTVANTFQVYTYPMLDGNTGKIPNERLNLQHRYCLIGAGSGNLGNINGTILPWQTENKPFVFEVDFRVAPLGNFTNGQGIIFTGNSHYSIGLELVLDGENSSTNDNKARIGCGLTTVNNSWDITWSWSDYVFEPMKWYTFKLSYDLTNYTVSFKKKGDSTWTQLGQFANSSKLYYASTSNLYIGAQGSNSSITPLWKGALVDVNSFKATNGNEIYFNGLDSLADYLTLNTLYISEFYEP